MFQTAYGSLTTGLDLKAGQTLLIRGGTSTVGLSAATIAKDLGATVLSTTRTPERAGELRAAGVDHPLERLGLAHRTVTVLGLSLPNGNSTDTSAAGQTRRQTLERITDSFAFHLSVAVPGAVAALVGDVCYAIVPAPIRKGKENVTAMAQRVSNDFLDRARDRPGGVAIGIGREISSSDPADLARSRHDADRTLRVLRQEPAGRVAMVADVQADALLLEIGDQLRNEGGLLDGPIARLRQHDREHGTTMAETVALWLDHLGNTLNASAAMDVHPNTFRYRLRRAAEIAQLNLDDPDERFAAMLEFRLTRQRPSAEGG